MTDNIQAVGFDDYGIVGEEAFPGGDGRSHSGAGLGLRYLTPIGPIRLDVATPISGNERERLPDLCRHRAGVLRRLLTSLVLLLPLAAAAQVESEQPGFFGRLFGSGNDNDRAFWKG